MGGRKNKGVASTLLTKKQQLKKVGEARDVRDFLTFGIVSMSNKFEEEIFL
jgi:hypothetical protein